MTPATVSGGRLLLLRVIGRLFLIAPLALATAAQGADLPSFLKKLGEPKAIPEAAPPAEAPNDVHIKEITKLPPRAAVVVDKNCPDIVQPYKLTDNLASLGMFSVTEHAKNIGAEIKGVFDKSAASPKSAGIASSTRLAAKQLNWLPMAAEVRYGEREHEQRLNEVIVRDSKQGNKYYPTADRILQDILSKLTERHDYKFQLFIRKDDGGNAAAVPGGFLYIDKDLIEKPARHPKAYFALAHELAHVLQRHETKELQSEVVDSFTAKDDLLKTISHARSDPNVVLAHVKVEKNRFTQHHIDQELQADSCAAKLLSRVFPDRQSLAAALNAFIKDLPKAEPNVAQPPPKSDAEKLAAATHDIVNTPVKRHPNSEERQQNLRSIYAEITAGAPAKRP